jgi:hypothetical protein
VIDTGHDPRNSYDAGWWTPGQLQPWLFVHKLAERLTRHPTTSEAQSPPKSAPIAPGSESKV